MVVIKKVVIKKTMGFQQERQKKGNKGIGLKKSFGNKLAVTGPEIKRKARPAVWNTMLKKTWSFQSPPISLLAPLSVRTTRQ